MLSFFYFLIYILFLYDVYLVVFVPICFVD